MWRRPQGKCVRFLSLVNIQENLFPGRRLCLDALPELEGAWHVTFKVVQNHLPQLTVEAQFPSPLCRDTDYQPSGGVVGTQVSSYTCEAGPKLRLFLKHPLVFLTTAHHPSRPGSNFTTLMTHPLKFRQRQSLSSLGTTYFSLYLDLFLTISPDSVEGKEIMLFICEFSKFSIVFIKVLFRVSLGYILKQTNKPKKTLKVCLKNTPLSKIKQVDFLQDVLKFPTC